jgi:3-deoxy-D-manno-octulosonic-acid transferase
VHLGETLYRTLIRAAPLALRLVAPFHEKARLGLDGRRAALPALRAWAAAHRDPDRPLLWLHAPSVGEALMAQATLAAVRERAPATQAVFTFFSPSAERVAQRVGADWSGYLPWDTTRDVRAALDALRPACVAFVRTEIWPVLGAEARRRGSGVVLVNAVLAAASSRTRWGSRFLLGPAYRRLDAVGAVTADDAARFQRLRVPPARVHVTGDARFDQVWQRVHALDTGAPLLRALRAAPGPWLVAGSTWPVDEERVAAALATVRGAGVRWRVIAAPHEPTPRHVAGLETLLRRAGVSTARLPQMHDAALPAADALIVDRVGVLADLYAVADAAYVGGGFGSAGLHSVVEPAALGVPVLFGPTHGSSQEAARLAEAGGGFVVTDDAALAGRLQQLAAADGGRSAHGQRAGAQARQFVEGELGGAARNAELILRAFAAPRAG